MILTPFAKPDGVLFVRCRFVFSDGIDLQIPGEPPGTQVKGQSIYECSHHFEKVIGEDQDEQAMDHGFPRRDRNGIGEKVGDQYHSDGIYHLAGEGRTIVSEPQGLPPGKAF